MKLKYFIGLIFFLIQLKVQSQYPVFSQFYSSPLNLNPALTGNSSSNWRVIGNQRNQWIASGTEPLTTMAISADGKLYRMHNNENNYVGGGLLFTQDKALEGAYKNSSVNGIISTHVSLDESDFSGISVGLGFNYNTTYIDFGSLSFSSQLSSSGFNRSLPTNEISLSNIKPYVSMFAGAAYTFSTERSEFEIGISGYRFIKSNRSALNDKNQIDPPMYNIHAEFQTFISEKVVFNSNALYTIVNGQHFYNFGFNIGNIIASGEDETLPTVLNTGIWYRNAMAIVPFVGLAYRGVQVGLSYDMNLASSINLNTFNTFEISFILRVNDSKSHPIPCPWK